jgi:hypothetical protein
MYTYIHTLTKLYIHTYFQAERESIFVRKEEENICAYIVFRYIHTYTHTYIHTGAEREHFYSKRSRKHLCIYCMYVYTYIHTYIHTGGEREHFYSKRNRKHLVSYFLPKRYIYRCTNMRMCVFVGMCCVSVCM